MSDAACTKPEKKRDWQRDRHHRRKTLDREDLFMRGDILPLPAVRNMLWVLENQK